MKTLMKWISAAALVTALFGGQAQAATYYSQGDTGVVDGSKGQSLIVTLFGGDGLRSFVNLHMDAGTFCWIFILWGTDWGFIVVYALLFLSNAATILLSMRRKFVSLSTSKGA